MRDGGPNTFLECSAAVDSRTNEEAHKQQSDVLKQSGLLVDRLSRPHPLLPYCRRSTVAVLHTFADCLEQVFPFLLLLVRS